MSTGYKIHEEIIKDDDGNKIGKIAIIVGGIHTDNPSLEMNKVVKKYVGDTPCCQFVEMTLCNPWTRIIISGINEFPFHTMEVLKRDEKIKKILGI